MRYATVRKHFHLLKICRNLMPQELFWDLMFSNKYTNNYIAQDFYSFPGSGRRINNLNEWLQHGMLPYDFRRKSRDFKKWIASFYISPKIQKMIRILTNRNCSKLITSSPNSCLIRTRGKNQSYFNIHVNPFGYFTCEREYYSYGDEDGVNLFGLQVQSMIGVELDKEFKCKTECVYKGFINTPKSYKKARKAFKHAYTKAGGTVW